MAEMTRDEQMRALRDWWNGLDGIPSSIVDHFPAFMEKCAEIGLCVKLPNGLRDIYEPVVPKPPHKHRFEVINIAPNARWLWLACADSNCHETRAVPNRLPLELPA